MNLRENWPYLALGGVIGGFATLVAVTVEMGLGNYLKQWQVLASAFLAVTVGVLSLIFARHENEKQRFSVIAADLLSMTQELVGRKRLGVAPEKVNEVLVQLPVTANLAIDSLLHINKLTKDHGMQFSTSIGTQYSGLAVELNRWAAKSCEKGWFLPFNGKSERTLRASIITFHKNSED